METWQNHSIIVRNGLYLRLSALAVSGGHLAGAVAILREFPREIQKDEAGAPWIVLSLGFFFLLTGLYIALATCCYKLIVSRDGIGKTRWWGQRRLSWEQIASCRRVFHIAGIREWTVLLLLDRNGTVLMETAPPVMGSIAPGFAEDYEAALRLAERFLHDQLAQGLLHQQRIDESKDGSLDFDQRPWPEFPYINKH